MCGLYMNFYFKKVKKGYDNLLKVSLMGMGRSLKILKNIRFTHTFSSDTSRDFKLLPTTRSSSSSSTILLQR